ncbi:hypothetical protein [Nitrospirillum pindoramense]|uniref:Uncharacterized protein n=1 Tax=Nitrospirillum amazonense TaxID=28077 RepID=A0A560HJB2_9PROT|nr:hypothetical protein [Nitrospirillum amazonense]TWB45494.1 hypothetical protein FBZ90_102452 [Nitrospirillum amazonense]
MAFIPSRACPSCSNRTIPAGKSRDLRRSHPFTCPSCGAQVYMKWRPAHELWAGLVIYLMPLIALYAFVFTDNGWVGGGVALAFLVLGIAVDLFLWPLGVLKPGAGNLRGDVHHQAAGE